MIDADAKGRRERYFEHDEEIRFTDTIYVSESHPGNHRYTYLKFKTNNATDWEANERDLRKRGSEYKYNNFDA